MDHQPAQLRIYRTTTRPLEARVPHDRGPLHAVDDSMRLTASPSLRRSTKLPEPDQLVDVETCAAATTKIPYGRSAG